MAASETKDSNQDDSNNKKKKTPKSMASLTRTFSFALDCGPQVQLLLVVGLVAGIANGLVYPALAYLFSRSFTDIAGAQTQGLESVRELAFTFLVVGVYALVAGLIQGWAFETVAYHASQRFRLTWFQALLRQDPAFFDVYDVAGMANQVGPNANKYRRGMGRKLGEGIQFLTTGVGGLAYAFYSSWKVACVVLLVIPFISVAALAVVSLNQTKGSRAAQSYQAAGGVAYTSVSGIQTVLSLNAVPEMLRQYTAATAEAYQQSVGILLKQGLANGMNKYEE